MKRVSIILTIIIMSIANSTGQGSITDLVQKGKQLCDSNLYEEAVEVFREALILDPLSELTNYEIAMAYHKLGDFNKTLKHCDKVIKVGGNLMVQAFILKGTCLDELGRSKESVKEFIRALKVCGEDYLLYYNMAFSYLSLEEYDNAIEAVTNAILVNPYHSGSHLFLGYLMRDQNRKVESLLSLYYFLFLESNSDRSEKAYRTLKAQFGGNIEKDQDKPNEITILVDQNATGGEFGPALLAISMIEATNTLEENKDKTEDELFVDNTTSLFKILGELKTRKDKGLYWDFYIPFFYELAKSEHIETFCYFMSVSSNDRALEWLEANRQKLDSFENWLDEI